MSPEYLKTTMSDLIFSIPPVYLKFCYNYLMKKFFIILLFIIFSSSCSFALEARDYSKGDNWLNLPNKPVYPVDVFYIYPTVCSSDYETNLCPVEDKNMRLNAKSVLKLQAGAFEPLANVYAPYYTQYNFKAFYNSNFEKIQNDTKENKQGLYDIYLALDYYFKILNEGRPYILVSHSQGSALNLIILSDYMKKHPEIYKNMVASYVIGYPVTKEFLKENPHLKFAKKSNDTGVIISYDVQSPDKSGINILYAKNTLLINPINWKRTEKYALQKDNLGSLDEKTLKIITPGVADAKIDKKKGAIICSTVDEESYEIKLPLMFGKGSYHGQDFQFYYLNLRQNAKERIEKFLKKNNL